MEQQNRTYLHHKPSEQALEVIKMVRQAYTYLHDVVIGNAPPSRERSEAITCLETSAMWAIKAIVVNDPASIAEEL